MANIITLTDLSAPELAVYAGLTEAQLRSRREPEKGIFIAESPKVIGYALDAGCVPLSLLMEERQIEGAAQGILARCGDVPVYTAERDLLARLTGFALTRGVLCAMRRPPLPLPEDVCRNARRIAVLDGIVDPTNVGAIFRSAAALNMDAVLVTASCCDPLYRRAVRGQHGRRLSNPLDAAGRGYRAVAPPASGAGLQGCGYGADGALCPHRRPRLMAEDRLAIALGTEGSGLPQATIDGCDYTVRIPMGHGVDSLNVTAASAVAFWQLRAR